eukprot:4034166-Prorocentrum_lima.AAC.1
MCIRDSARATSRWYPRGCARRHKPGGCALAVGVMASDGISITRQLHHPQHTAVQAHLHPTTVCPD